jgi:ABC-type uncharacterized transport system substrate-binding protein
MRRAAAALALWLCAASALAQDRENPPVVGILRMNTADNVEPFATGFRNALAALGLVDGRNIRIEVRLAEGDVERLPELAQSLVREKASVHPRLQRSGNPRGAASDEHDPDHRE